MTKLNIQQIKDMQTEYGFQIILDDTNNLVTFKDILSIDKNSRKKSLGQIFTPNWIADYMAALCIKEPLSKGIEPCFGRGVFIKNMAKRLVELSNNKKDVLSNLITGIEIDPELFVDCILESEKIFDGCLNYNNLYLGNFFDFNEKVNFFDFALMNPPYVRQEELSSENLPKNLRKDKLIKAVSSSISCNYLPTKANLYFYFILHLTNFIKEGGKIIAITYNSWLYSESGKSLHNFLLDNFKIKYIIDFDQEAFEDAVIGSCIILIEKATGNNKKSARDNNIVHFIRLRAEAPLANLIEATERVNDKYSELVNRHMVTQKKLYKDDKWQKYFFLPKFHEELVNNPKLVPLKNLATIFRGLEPKSSRFFIMDLSLIENYDINREYIIPIVKNPKHLCGHRISERCYDTFLLNISKTKNELHHDPKSKGVLNYLSDIENKIVNAKNDFKTLKSLIKDNNDFWYMHRLKDTGEIIFSYIIRKNKKFYINDENIITTDNFYNINPQVDKFALLAILNSSLVKYFLEISGRTQGSGLLKVQVYELKSLLVPDLNKTTASLIEELSKLGKMLVYRGVDSCKIDLYNSDKLDEVKKIIDEKIFTFLGNEELLGLVKLAEREIMEERLKRKNKGLN